MRKDYVQDNRGMDTIVSALLLIKQIEKLCVTTGVSCFWPTPGFLWENNVLFCPHVYLSCRERTSCWQMITVFIHNDCDRENTYGQGKAVFVCGEAGAFFISKFARGEYLILCFQLFLFKLWLNWRAVTNVWSSFWENTWDLNVHFKRHSWE